MEIEYVIPYKGLTAGRHGFEFDITLQLFEQFGYADVKDASVKARVELERMREKLLLDVVMSGEVTVECDRCLEELALPVEYSGAMEVKFFRDETERGAEDDEDVMWISAGDNEIDLTRYLYESVILSLPYKRVHEEGRCNQAMLERFRIVSQEEFDALQTKTKIKIITSN